VIQTAMGELMSIHNDEVIALLAEDFERLEKLRARLQMVRTRKAHLIERYRDHVTHTAVKPLIRVVVRRCVGLR